MQDHDHSQEARDETQHAVEGAAGRPGALPAAESAYLDRVVAILQQRLGQRLLGVYLFGSAAYGDYEPGISDLDVQAVLTTLLDKQMCREIAASLTHRVLPCPARRLELVIYARPAIDPAARHPRFDLNLNTGAGEDDHLVLDPAEESSHWFLLDIAMGHELGRSLLGPQPAKVFAPIPRRWCLEAIGDSLAWHRRHESASANSVLNACRGWRYAVTGTFGSKLAGAAWARRQPNCPSVVAQAEQRRLGGPPLSAAEVTELVEIVGAAVRAALLREQDAGWQQKL
ncbi:MAG TPA: aminoglycoside adenylyltransferase domain-containing protein [Herpetosiphonaceae bacterium]